MIALPEKIIKYVVFHEMTHIKERKHNHNFWQNVIKEFPNYKKMEISLLEYWFYLENTTLWKNIRG